MMAKKTLRGCVSHDYAETIADVAKMLGVPRLELCEFFRGFDVPGIDNSFVVREVVWADLAMGVASSHRDKAITPWREANALVCAALRNNEVLEDFHAGRHEEVNEDPAVSRLSDREMRALMIFTTRRLAMLLYIRDHFPNVYQAFLRHYLRVEPGRWVDNEKDAAKFVRFTTDQEWGEKAKLDIDDLLAQHSEDAPRIKNVD